MTVRILIGDVRAKLAEIADESIDCVVTSPPYWGLRDYGVDGQIGLERTLGEHLDVMVEVFDLVRAKMKPQATLWLNYGDCYATKPNGRSAADTKAAGNDDRTFRDKPFDTVVGSGLKPKDLVGLPWRIAFAMQAAGWWLRQDIIWHKPNPMPESVEDRCTKAHEYIFLLTRSSRYHYDAAAIVELALRPEGPGNITPQRLPGERAGENANLRNGLHKVGQRETRNKRSVWTVPTSAFAEAHFATFPPDLIEPCILAGCPVGGTVLDPFGGAGTTGLVADRLQRHAVLIEINPAYAEMARQRIESDAGCLFDQVRVEAANG